MTLNSVKPRSSIRRLSSSMICVTDWLLRLVMILSEDCVLSGIRLPFEVRRATRHSAGFDGDARDLGHVAAGGGRGAVLGIAALADVHVRGVPVPPVVGRGDGLEGGVVLGCLVQDVGGSGDAHAHTLPASRRSMACSLLFTIPAACARCT